MYIFVTLEFKRKFKKNKNKEIATERQYSETMEPTLSGPNNGFRIAVISFLPENGPSFQVK